MLEPGPEEETLQISKHSKIYAGMFTLGFFAMPLTVYCSSSLFKKFCDFHTRALKLNQKSPGQVVGLSLIMSIVYSSVLCPVYYMGLLKILGLSSITDVAGTMKKNAVRTYKKYPKMKEIDDKILYELDKRFGIEADKTNQFVKSVFGDDFENK
jgi:hypothetical protein